MFIDRHVDTAPSSPIVSDLAIPQILPLSKLYPLTIVVYSPWNAVAELPLTLGLRQAHWITLVEGVEQIPE